MILGLKLFSWCVAVQTEVVILFVLLVGRKAFHNTQYYFVVTWLVVDHGFLGN